MKKQMKHISIVIMAVVMTALSCTDDLPPTIYSEGEMEEQPIQFTVDDSQDWYQTGSEIETTRAMTSLAFAPHIMSTSAAGIKIRSSVVNGIDGMRMTDNVTRGNVQSSLEGDFGVSAFLITNGGDDISTITPTYMYNEKAVKGANGWALATPCFWPAADKKLKFFAYTPFNDADYGITLSEKTVSGTPYIDFIVKRDIQDQIDLMTAHSTATAYGPKVKAQLPFKHALTCVKFAVGSGLPANQTITKITLKNIVEKGRYFIGEYWDVPTYPTTDIWQYDIEDLSVPTNTANNTIIVHPNGEAYSTLLMIPQAFNSDDQKIEVTLQNNATNATTTIFASLKNSEWLPGTTVTYQLCSSDANVEYIFNVTPVTAAHDGGIVDFKVVSYRQNVSGNDKMKQSWKVVGYSEDNGKTWSTEKPQSANWFGLVNSSGEGSTESETGKVLFNAQTGTTSPVSETQDREAQEAVLRATQRGKEAPYDLSMHDFGGQLTKRNTANCYVINAYGSYSLPLVYGNGIKDGEQNTVAYNKSNYKDYKNRNITNAYIYENKDASNNNYAPGDAVVVWQDVDNLLTNVRLDDAKENLLFEIEKGNISQGNAVVAVRDDSNNHHIMWSWHIWVTAADVYATIPVINHDRRKFNFMPIPLGYCSMGGSQTSYTPRTILVKLQQSSGLTAIMPITQTGGKELAPTAGNMPFWQGGRKDPQPGWDGKTFTPVSNVPRKYYQSPNGYEYAVSSSASTISQSIISPLTYYTVNVWSSEIIYNMWDAGATKYTNPAPDYIPIKSIYDPCPAGFHVTDCYASTGFTTTGSIGSNTNSAQWNNAGVYANGFKIWTDGNKNNTIYLPASGLRRPGSYNGNIGDPHAGIWYWTSTMPTAGTFYTVAILSSAFYVYYDPNTTGYGFSIFPVSDNYD